MKYEGPIYRPPSEAHSLLIQATIGCPHNKCTFCMVYKKGPPYKVRPVPEIQADLEEARRLYGSGIRSVFFPAGNTIAMPTPELAEVCRSSRTLFPECERITVYGSSKYLDEKGFPDLRVLAASGLSRIHVGLESGDDVVLEKTKKGADAGTQVRACRAAIKAGLEVSVYVVLGLGGKERTWPHARATAEVLNLIRPQFVRLRTFVPKVNTLMLHQVRTGVFEMLSPHEVLGETRKIIEALDFPAEIVSDHYTNYLDVTGRLPQDRDRLLAVIRDGLKQPESDFRPFFIGSQ
ncbi:MAG: radical SAM protein [Thermodesulfobacteriota bacterium]|nr:radical SAM protein [Thermodesulfobacteriota bacterium]